MAEFITQAMIDTFSADVRAKAQQEVSRLRAAVRTEAISGERASFDQIDPTAMEPRLGRHVPTNWGDPDGERRWVIPQPFDKAFQVDVPDKLRVLADPTNYYTAEMSKAAGRAIDDVILDALDGTSITGRSGTGTTAYNTANDVALGATGLNLAKTLSALQILNANEEDENDRYLCYSARQLSDILAITNFTSADFASVKALVAGSMTAFLGFTWVRSERLPAFALGPPVQRINFFWQKTAMILGMAMEGRATVDRLPEHRNSTGIQFQIDMGSVRMRETGVGRILCQE